jgi:hypothetical protein
VNCPECGRPLVCAICGHSVGEREKPGGRPESGPATPRRGPPADDQAFLVVARGQGDLLDQLKEVVGDLGWVRPIQDRRDDPTILPREGREGSVHLDEEI